MRLPVTKFTTRAASSLATGARRLDGFNNPTVWSEFTPLAISQKAVNLGQGFPDWPTPDFIKTAIRNAVDDDFNQYTRSQGHLSLVKTLAEDSGPSFKRELDPETNIVCSVGSTEGIYMAMQSLVNPGDEVVILEPAMDIYAAQVQLAGGTPVPVGLKTMCNAEIQKRFKESGGDAFRSGLTASEVFRLDLEELESKITSRTRVLMLNSPHNPTGKVFSESELKAISEIVQKHEHLLVFSDEVYEHISYGSDPPPRIATMPGMWERTLTFSSAAKTFSVTGWKVGWCIGHEALVRNVSGMGQWVHFCVSTCAQEALSRVLKDARQPFQGHESYYHWLKAEYARKRELLVNHTAASGLIPIVPDAGFFVMTNTSLKPLPLVAEEAMYVPSGASGAEVTNDWAYCRWMTTKVGVAAIPPSAFCSTEESKNGVKDYIRLAFCKEDSALDEAGARMLREL